MGRAPSSTPPGEAIVADSWLRVRDLREPACVRRRRRLHGQATTGKRGRSPPSRRKRRASSIARSALLLRTTRESGEQPRSALLLSGEVGEQSRKRYLLTAHAASALRRDQPAEARLEVGRDLKQRPPGGADQRDVPLAHDQPGDLDLAGARQPPRSRAPEVASSGQANAQPLGIASPMLSRAPSPPAVSRTATNA